MTISKCCGAEVSYHFSNEGTNYMSCRKCLKPCDTKPMKHEINVRDEFRLGAWEWKVETVNLEGQIRCTSGDRRMYLPQEDADKLDWIEPKPTCSNEFAEAFKKANEMRQGISMDEWVDSRVEKK